MSPKYPHILSVDTNKQHSFFNAVNFTTTEICSKGSHLKMLVQYLLLYGEGAGGDSG